MFFQRFSSRKKCNYREYEKREKNAIVPNTAFTHISIVKIRILMERGLDFHFAGAPFFGPLAPKWPPNGASKKLWGALGPSLRRRETLENGQGPPKGVPKAHKEPKGSPK